MAASACDIAEKRRREYEQYKLRHAICSFGLPLMTFKKFCAAANRFPGQLVRAWRAPDGPDWRRIHQLEMQFAICFRSVDGKEAEAGTSEGADHEP